MSLICLAVVMVLPQGLFLPSSCRFFSLVSFMSFDTFVCAQIFLLVAAIDKSSGIRAIARWCAFFMFHPGHSAAIPSPERDGQK
mmetsp:Transcript_98824/g.283890  ORF Transcript_98824/g.283890 Transcript_98824/m.283890 type:complete len:84 (-) Transcript_98824:4-255(-)